MKINGNLTVTTENQENFKELEQVSGYIFVRPNVMFTAPELKKSGSLYVGPYATFTAPKLEKSGSIDVKPSATFTAPKLEKSGYIDVRENSTFNAPELIEVSDYISVSENATFTAQKLEKSGYISVGENATLTAPKLKKSGSIYVSENATFIAQKLEKSGSIDVKPSATFTAPKLEKSGNIYVKEHATFTAQKLIEAGYIYVRENATFTAQKLEKSGSIYVRENATLIAPELEIKNNVLKLGSKEYKVDRTDGILMFVEQNKESKEIKICSGIQNLKIVDGTPVFDNFFLASKQGVSAHGNTLKSAISDLQFKIASEKLRNEPIKKETLLTVKHYRLITGACDAGIRNFMSRNGLEFEVINNETKEINPIKAFELLPLLEKNKAYGLEKFKSLISF